MVYHLAVVRFRKQDNPRQSIPRAAPTPAAAPASAFLPYMFAPTHTRAH